MRVFSFAVLWAVVLWTLSAASAFAGDIYLDDRSSAEQLVRSLYSAINNHQYARAYSYFSEPPEKDFDTYQMGFEDTEHVNVLTGTVSGDGAAGSTFFNLPTAIRAQGKDGKFSYFAGCYVVRAINADQEPPYTPYRIQSAKLKPIAKDSYNSYSLPKCGDANTADENITLEPAAKLAAAKAAFVADNQTQCNKTPDTRAGINEPEVNEISYAREGAAKTDPQQKATLYSFSCAMAAYNETDVFYLFSDAEGLQRLSFAEPHLTYKYLDDAETKLKSMSLAGFTASEELINAGYDAKTQTISSFAKWRGLGDAFSAGQWVFSDGQFILQSYDVDPTMDEKQTPIAVIKSGQLVLKP